MQRYTDLPFSSKLRHGAKRIHFEPMGHINSIFFVTFLSEKENADSHTHCTECIMDLDTILVRGVYSLWPFFWSMSFKFCTNVAFVHNHHQNNDKVSLTKSKIHTAWLLICNSHWMTIHLWFTLFNFHWHEI